jgi:hypothetical protein
MVTAARAQSRAGPGRTAKAILGRAPQRPCRTQGQPGLEAVSPTCRQRKPYRDPSERRHRAFWRRPLLASSEPLGERPSAAGQLDTDPDARLPKPGRSRRPSGRACRQEGPPKQSFAIGPTFGQTPPRPLPGAFLPDTLMARSDLTLNQRGRQRIGSPRRTS